MLGNGRVDGNGSARDDSAADELADTREDEVRYVSDVHSVESRGFRDAVVDRKQELAPAEGTEQEGRCTRSHRKNDEFPSACLQPLHEISPFHIPEREVKQSRSEGRRKQVFDYICYLFVHIMRLPVSDRLQIYPIIC